MWNKQIHKSHVNDAEAQSYRVQDDYGEWHIKAIVPRLFQSLNSLRPSDAYMRR